MDVDLSTDLDALLPLVAPLVTGHSDVAIGTRLAPGARVVRGPRREAISRSYNLLIKATLRSGFSDAQCGFKAIRTEVAHALLPMVEDQGWFFDTELLVLAEHNGLRIHEVPVDWVDDPDSRVDVVSTAKADLRGIWRVLSRLARGHPSLSTASLPWADAFAPGMGSQLVRFASIGLMSTVVFALLFAFFVEPLGAFRADVVALGVCSVANTAANRRLTFALRRLRAEVGTNATVQSDATGGDQLIAMSPRTEPGCGEEFVISQQPAFVDRWVAERQAAWLERVLAEEHERDKKHPDKIELPD